MLLETLQRIFTIQPPAVVAGWFGVVGLGIGHLLFCWSMRIADPRNDPDDERHSPLSHLPLIGPMLFRNARVAGVRLFGWGTLTELLTAAVFAGFVYAYLEHGCQSVPEVRPFEVSKYLRILFHLVLLSLLIASTCADFRDYVIPDSITVTGIIIAVGGATWSGDLQMIHIWVDWHHEIPGHYGPYIPDWLKHHHHLHGLAWSLAGMATGAGVVWLLRAVASFILGREAMGFGDVTLMAMIGAFLGWQATLVVLALSPFSGMVMAMMSRLVAGKSYIPFGPFLSLGAVVVVFGWKWIWLFELGERGKSELSVRNLFGDWPSIVILCGIAFGALVVLLSMMRLYRRIPGKKREQET